MKTPARFAAVLASLLAASPVLSADVGRDVTFKTAARAAGGGTAPCVVYDSGVSAPIAESWDTVLIQGESPDPALVFQAARADDGDWRDMEVHRFPGGRFWAKLRVRKAPGRLRLRALNCARLDEAVSLYGVEAFVQEPADEGKPVIPPPGPQNPAAPRPPVHARAEWKALPPTEPYAPDPLRWRITLHQSEGKHPTTLAESEEEARFIQDFHVHGRGWIDIGYHFLVDAAGNILEGRPEGVIGAHTESNNDGNIGIALLGTYQPPQNDVPTKAQLNAVAALGRYLVLRYGIHPQQLKGHRDYNDTDCPGNILYGKLDALRLALAGTPASPLNP